MTFRELVWYDGNGHYEIIDMMIDIRDESQLDTDKGIMRCVRSFLGAKLLNPTRKEIEKELGNCYIISYDKNIMETV